MSFLNTLKCSFGIDRRSLSLYRVFLGLTIIGDIWDRSRDLETFYSDEGILPRYLVLTQLGGDQSWFDVYLSTGSVFWISMLFLIHAFWGLLVVVGYYTKLATILAFIFTHSLIYRVLPLAHGGDLYLNCLLFVSIFLPLDEYYSVDQFLSQKKRISFLWDIKPNEERDNYLKSSPKFLSLLKEAILSLNSNVETNKKSSSLFSSELKLGSLNEINESSPHLLTKNLILNLGTTVAVFQVFCLYFYAHYMKTGKPWTDDFTAAFYALKLDFFRLPLGDFFLNFPLALKFLTWAVRKWQFWGALCLIVPIPTTLPTLHQYLRLFGCLGFFFMHLAFGLCLRLGTFFWISITGVFLLLPPVFWDDILFPVLDNMFSTSLTIIKYPSTHFSSYSPQSSNHFVDHTWFLTDVEGKNWSGFHAWVKIMKLSPILFPIGWICGLSFVFPNIETLVVIYNKLENYQKVRTTSTNTQQGETEEKYDFFDDEENMRPIIPKYPRKKSSIHWKSLGSSLLLSMGALLTLWFIIYSNEITIERFAYTPLPEPPESMINFYAHVDLLQSWAMFAPQPPDSHWYYVMEGKLNNEKVIDLWKKENLFLWEGGNDWNNNESISWDQPSPFAASIGSHRWFKFYENGINLSSRNTAILPSFGSWICRKWNQKHGSSKGNKLQTFKIWILFQEQFIDGSRGNAEKQLLWHHIC